MQASHARLVNNRMRSWTHCHCLRSEGSGSSREVDAATKLRVKPWSSLEVEAYICAIVLCAVCSRRHQVNVYWCCTSESASSG